MSLSNKLSICRFKPSPGALKRLFLQPLLLIIILAASTAFSQATARTALKRVLQQEESVKAPPGTGPTTILRNARLIYVRRMTVFLEATELENELRKRPEFQHWGLAVTRNEVDADLILEVNRKIFTRFVYTVIDPRTNIVVMSGKLSSLGGKLSTKIAKRFIKQMQRVRQ